LDAVSVICLLSRFCLRFGVDSSYLPIYCKSKEIVQYIFFDKKKKNFSAMDKGGKIDSENVYDTIWQLMFSIYKKKFSIKAVLFVCGINVRIIEKHCECFPNFLFASKFLFEN
jgi:hypothetical protein